ncbi:MAG TPA: WD40 repeat domain-containing protein, partial [Isosphaeraceae bacterium]|nr:WD40 repeat domain-containing protein [Isosphaeraceae bacterium]
MSRRSSSQPLSYRSPRNVQPECAPRGGRVRFPFLSWKRIVGLGVLAWVPLYLADGTTPAPGKADHSVLGKHSGRIISVAFNPSGRWLAASGGTRSVSLWDMSCREPAMALEPAPEPEVAFMNCLAFTPDGLNLAVANDRGSVSMWDVASGNLWHNLRASTQSVRSLAFSPDGRLLATGISDGSIVLWDATMLCERAVLLGSRRQINCVAFSPDGRTLASASTDGRTKLWDISSGENIRTLKPNANDPPAIQCVAYSPDGRILATACAQSGVALWDESTGRLLVTCGECGPGAMTLAFSPVGGMLAWGATDGRIE